MRDRDAKSDQGAAGEESTRRLLDRARGGDLAARERLYAKLGPRLVRLAHGKLPVAARRVHDTDDIAQNAALRMFRPLERFDPEHSGSFGKYLETVVDSVIRDALRAVARRPQAEESADDLPAASPSPIEAAIERESFERYQRGLGRLDDDDQALIRLKIELDLPYRDIASLLGRPSPDAARVAVGRAIQRLAREMGIGAAR